MTIIRKSNLEQWRRCVTQEGPSAAPTARNGWIAVMDSILELMEAMLEDTESEEQADQDHHQNQARAKHANSGPAATHLQSSGCKIRSEK